MASHHENILTGYFNTDIFSANPQILLRTEEAYAAKYYLCKTEIKII
jgi:hypothetical protein